MSEGILNQLFRVKDGKERCLSTRPRLLAGNFLLYLLSPKLCNDTKFCPLPSMF